MSPTPPPPKSQVLADPYADWFTGKDADLPPPVPAAPGTGERTMMRLYVPSEHTEMDLGHGNSEPGIRMITDRHVHLTARTPLTTVSLGSPAGPGIAGDPGYVLRTDANKKETVAGDVTEIYGGKKTETVSLGVEEIYKNTKTETVEFAVTETYKNAHFYNVGDIAKYTFARDKDEHIAGNWLMDVKGHKKETIHGDRSWLNKGKWFSVTVGQVNDVFIGEKNSVSLSTSHTLNIGAAIAINSSAAINTSLLKVEHTCVKITRDEVKVDHADIKSATHRADVSTSTAALSKNEASIVNAAIFIVK